MATKREKIAARAAAKPIKPTGKPGAIPTVPPKSGEGHPVMCSCADCRKSVLVTADNPGEAPLCRCGDTLGRDDGTSLVPGHRCGAWGRVAL